MSTPVTLPFWLADANVFINAERWGWDTSKRTLDGHGTHHRLSTTDAVRGELHHSYRLPAGVTVLPPSAIHPRVEAYARANATPEKMASHADLTLIQALLDHPEYAGIVTDDEDILRIHPQSLVREMTGRAVRCFRTKELAARITA